MKKYFKYQLKNTIPLTVEKIAALQCQTDYFGTVAQPGDILLWFFEEDNGLQLRNVMNSDTSMLSNNYNFVRHSGDIKDQFPVFVKKDGLRFTTPTDLSKILQAIEDEWPDRVLGEVTVNCKGNTVCLTVQ